MRAAPLLLLLSLMAGCEAPSDTPGAADGSAGNSQAREIRMANPFHDQLIALRPGLQRLTMMRAIRQTGNRCQRVDNNAYQQDYKNLRMWVAICGVEQKTWAVYIAPNGDIQVRDCADMGRLSLPRCENPPPALPDTDEPKFEKGAADNAFGNRK